MNVTPFDILALARTFRDEAGFTPESPEGTAPAPGSALPREIATKADIAALRSDLETLKRDITIRVGGMLAVSLGVLLAVRFLG